MFAVMITDRGFRGWGFSSPHHHRCQCLLRLRHQRQAEATETVSMERCHYDS